MSGETASASPATGGPALVLVRATSPFLPNAVLAQREAACLALATTMAARTELITRTAASGGGGAVERLRDRAVATNASILVTWSAYGLVTTEAELVTLVELLQHGAVLFEAQTGQLVAADPHRLAQVLPLRPASASYETRRHAARTREGRQAVARDGGWLGGRCPLGWVVDEHRDVALDLTAAGYIRAATTRVAAGTRVGLVVAQWNAAGFTTVTGRSWTFGSARRVLLRARNAGLVEYQGRIVGRSAWPAIVTVPEWTTARQTLAARSRQEIA